MSKKIFAYTVVAVMGIILLNLMFDLLQEIHLSKRVNNKMNEIILVNIIAFILGGLIEWRKALQILQGNLKVSLWIIPALILFAFAIIPHVQWPLIWGRMSLFPLTVLKSMEIHIVLSVISGIMFIRSLKDTTV